MNDTLIATKWGLGGLVVIEVLLVSTILVLGAKTELLRDTVPAEKDFTKRPYSMAKTQLMFWIGVIVGCFIYIYFARETFVEVLNNTALVLLGMSTATTALSAVAQGPSSSSQPKVASDHPQPAPEHEDFLKDILSDNEGMNVHRLQMLLWTVVFGIIFVHQVIKGGKFPDYDAQIYGLMGISSLTYVWFKRSER